MWKGSQSLSQILVLISSLCYKLMVNQKKINAICDRGDEWKEKPTKLSSDLENVSLSLQPQYLHPKL